MSQYTPEQEQAILLAHGKDPSQWSISDDGQNMIFGGGAAMPAIPSLDIDKTQPTVTPQQQFTPTETFVKSAIDVAPSTAAGGWAGLAAGGAAAEAALPLAGIPFVGPFIPPAVGLGVGLLTTMGVGGLAKKGQEALETEAYKQRIAAMQAEHPTAAFWGNVAAMPAGGMLPSPSGLAQGLGAIPKMIAGGVKAATPEELQSLVNVGLGAGLGGGQAAYQGESPEDIAKEMAVGAVFNKQIGAHAGRTIADSEAYRNLLAGMQRPVPEAPAGPALLNPPSTVIDARRRNLTPEGRRLAAPPEDFIDVQQIYTPPYHPPPDVKQGPTAASPEAVPTPEKPTVPPVQKPVPAPAPTAPPVAPPVAPPEAAVAAPVIPPIQQTPAEAARAQTRQNVTDADAEMQALAAKLKAQTANLPKEQKYQRQGLTPAGEELLEQSKRIGVPVDFIDPNYFNAMAQDVSARHGIEDIWAPGHAEEGGAPVLGEAKIGQRKNIINPELADVGTQFHENFHHIWDSMNVNERQQMLDTTKDDFDAFMKKNPDFQGGHEEYLALEHGYRSVLSALNAGEETSLGKYWNDLKSLWKTKYGTEPSKEDVLRASTYKLINGISNIKGIRPTALAGAMVPEERKGLPAPSPALPEERGLPTPTPPVPEERRLGGPKYQQEGLLGNIRTQDIQYGSEVRDENGNMLLPHENVRRYFRNFGEYPDVDTLKSKLGYTDQDIAKLNNDPLLKSLVTEPSSYDRKAEMDANYRDYFAKRGLPSADEAKQKYIDSIRQYFTRFSNEELYGRRGFMKAEVENEPTYVSTRGGVTSIQKPHGYYEPGSPWQGKIVAQPDRPQTATHEAIHELFHEGLRRDPAHMSQLLDSVKGDKDFNNALKGAAKKLKGISPEGYGHMEDSYINWSKGDPHGAMDIIDEALAQRVSTTDAKLKEHASILASKLFGSDYETMLQRAETSQYGARKALAASYDPYLRKYYQKQGLGQQAPRTPEERKAADNARRIAERRAQAQEIAEIRQRQAERDAAMKGIAGPIEPAPARSAGIPPTVYPRQEGYEPVGVAPRRHELQMNLSTMKAIDDATRDMLRKSTGVRGLENLPASDVEEIQSKVRTTLMKEGILPHTGMAQKYPDTYFNRVKSTAAMEAKREFHDLQLRRMLEGTSLQKKVGKGAETELGELIAGKGGEREEMPTAGETEVAMKPTKGAEKKGMTPEEEAAWQARMTERERIAAEKKAAKEAKLKAGEEKAREREKKKSFETEAGTLHQQFKDMLEADDNLAEENRMPDEKRAAIEKAVDELSKTPPLQKINGVEFMQKMLGAKAGGKYQRYGIGGQHPNATEGQKYSFYRTRPELDEALRKAPGSEIAYRALSALPNIRDRFFGRYFDPIRVAAKGMSPVSKKRVLDTLYNEDVAGKQMNNHLRGQERTLYDTIRKSLVQKQTEQKAAGQKVTAFTPTGVPYKRDARINPTYAPSLMRSEVMNALVEKTGRWKEYEQALTNHWKTQGMSDNEIQQHLDSFRTIGDDRETNETKFAANRLAEGVGIPPELREQNLEKAFQRYFSRVSADRAYHDTVESKQDVMKNLSDNANAYRDIVDHLKGESYDKAENFAKSLNRVFTSAMLGPLTNIHIGLSTIFNPMQYVKATELASVYGKAMASWSKANENAYKNGYARKDFNTFHDIIDKNLTSVQKLGALASKIGQIGGRQIADEGAKTVAQALSEQIVPLRLSDARRGDVYAQKLIKQLDPYWTPEKQYTSQEQSQLASTLAGFVHGAHDYRTLPAWMNKETIFKPFVSLMSWTTSQTNQWMKHVWEPATKGNLQPLILSTLGAAIGGYAIQQLRQAVSAKKTNIPSLTEIAQSSRGVEGNIPLLAYNFMQMASYTGYAGLMSTLGKDLFDIVYKNSPQGAAFPADEAISSVTKTATDAIQAFSENPSLQNLKDIGTRAIFDVTKENFQSARLALNWAADMGVSTESEVYRKQLADKEQQLRRWRMVEGQPYEPEGVASGANVLRNLQMQRFKQTRNIPEAAQELPDLIAIARQQSAGNPEIFRQRLQALKENSYQTMPSPERMPMQFSQYMQYLQRTQGAAVAQQVMQDYMRQNAINRAKSQIVP